MRKPVFYEDVGVGDQLPQLVKHTTSRQLVKYAAATGDYHEIHFDKDFAHNIGLPGVLVQGWLVGSFLAQLVIDWIGEEGTLKKFGCSYRGMHFAGEDVICKGKTVKKYVDGDEHCVECEIWSEGVDGKKRVVGTAIVSLRSK